MRGPASAYATLGLEPDADLAAIEAAYRRLIKLHHPDRSGGDARRAAEINRAYFELRQRDPPLAPGGYQAVPPVPRRSRRVRTRHYEPRRRRSLWPLVVLAIAAVLVVERQRLAVAVPRWIDALAALQAPAATSGGRPPQIDSASFDGPLRPEVIARAIGDAARLAKRGDEAALAEHSRACHLALRAKPELVQLDRCAAFDDAAAALSDRDPVGESGEFSASAVTARQMYAASLLSSDYLAIERRLDRIRMMVAMTLLPPPAPPPKPPASDETDPSLDGDQS